MPENRIPTSICGIPATGDPAQPEGAPGWRLARAGLARVMARTSCSVPVLAAVSLLSACTMPIGGPGYAFQDAAGPAPMQQAAYEPEDEVDDGFLTEGLERITARVQADIAAGRIPGAVMLVARGEHVVYEKALGARNPASGWPMSADAIFRIYSMTKPIVSVGAMMLVEEGRLQLDDPVSRYLPEMGNLKVGVERSGPGGRATLDLVPTHRDMTIHDLLRHTSGLTYGVFGKSLVKSEYRKAGIASDKLTNAQMVQALGKLPLAYQPGSTWEYGRSTDVLGAVIEKVSGKPLDVYLEERILRPLKMQDSGFWVDVSRQDRIAEPFAIDPDTGKSVHLLDVKTKPVFLSGGGGMVSTAHDYLRFAQILLNGGELEGVRLLSPETVGFMLSDHLAGVRGPAYLPGPGYGFGLGFAVRLA
ncbi:MAG: serine hydrolase domain-containing protein, partial [Gammaproteobacteria bacterium]